MQKNRKLCWSISQSPVWKRDQGTPIPGCAGQTVDEIEICVTRFPMKKQEARGFKPKFC